MMRKALLLTENDLSPDDLNVCKLLDFFGIPFRVLKSDELSTSVEGLVDIDGHEYCILGSVPLIAKAMGLIDESHKQLPSLLKTAKSVYIYRIEASLPCKQLLKFITNDLSSEITHLEASNSPLAVNREYLEFCGPMLGLRMPIVPADTDFAFHISRRGEGIKSLISANDMDVFLKVTKDGVNFFLNACSKVIDIESRFKKGFFDIKDYFLSAVPIVMYLKWAFRDVCWKSREISACLIVDDPLLKPMYGFFDFRKVLELMDRHGFSTNIAFIPWNWRRTNSKVAELFNKHPDKYSLSIHGCDHIASEFGTESTSVLNWRIKVAKRRMEFHKEKTGCIHDPIMVFPQGIFSKQSAKVLKHNNFIAAVNTDVTPSNNEGVGMEISEVWDLAIMKYGDFPIFTRRYPEHGIENFAFDILLGKPCLIVVHHEFFKNNCRDVIEFIERLNSLNCNLNWRGLGELIRNCFQEQQDSYDNVSVRMYGNNLSIENSASEQRTYTFVKKESDADNIKTVKVNQKRLDWHHNGTYLRFNVMSPAKDKFEICIEYDDIYGESSQNFSAGYVFKNSLRRYLSEVRDNYLCKNDLLYNCASKLKRLIS